MRNIKADTVVTDKEGKIVANEEIEAEGTDCPKGQEFNEAEKACVEKVDSAEDNTTQ